jgi:multidrug resistance efflux pump
MNKMKRERVAATAAVAAAALAFVLLVPLPHSVKCTVEVQPRQGRQIFAAVPGQIKQVHYKPGQVVKEGDVLLELENPDLELELTELAGRLAEAEQALHNIRALRIVDPTAGDQLERTREIRDSIKKQYEERKREAERLTITVPQGVSGTIIPPPSKQDHLATVQGRLRGWTGTAFDSKNVGGLVTPTDLICQIGDPRDMEAVLIVDQAYVDLVREGQSVRVLLEAHTRRAYESKIEEIASTELQIAPAGMSAARGGRLETKPDATGQMRPLNTSYQARAPLTDVDGTLQAGMQGQARIYTDWQTVASRVYRFCAKTFHFDL